MNKHFEDARYYLKRTATHVALGIRELLEPVENRIRARLGLVHEPEPTRRERIQQQLLAMIQRVQMAVRGAVATIR